MRQLKLLIVALVLVAGPALAGPFEGGWAAYQRQDYATALRELRPLASRGDVTAQHILGPLAVKAEIRRWDWKMNAFSVVANCRTCGPSDFWPFRKVGFDSVSKPTVRACMSSSKASPAWRSLVTRKTRSISSPAKGESSAISAL